MHLTATSRRCVLLLGITTLAVLTLTASSVASSNPPGKKSGMFMRAASSFFRSKKTEKPNKYDSLAKNQDVERAASEPGLSSPTNFALVSDWAEAFIKKLESETNEGKFLEVAGIYRVSDNNVLETKALKDIEDMWPTAWAGYVDDLKLSLAKSAAVQSTVFKQYLTKNFATNGLSPGSSIDIFNPIIGLNFKFEDIGKDPKNPMKELTEVKGLKADTNLQLNTEELPRLLDFIEQLDVNMRKVLARLFAHVTKVASFSSVNQMNIHNLSRMLGPPIFSDVGIETNAGILLPVWSTLKAFYFQAMVQLFNTNPKFHAAIYKGWSHELHKSQPLPIINSM